MEDNQSKVIFASPYKSVAAAILLSLFLGPIGLLYANFIAAIVFSVILVLSLFVHSSSFFNFILGIVWVVGIFWSAISTTRYNKKITHYFWPDFK